MLAQLVTGEAKPSNKEKWFVDFHPFPLLTWLTATSGFDGRL